MKNPNNVVAFAAAIKAKVEKANSLGTKTTWDTADHLAALAKSIAAVTDPEHDEEYVKLIREVLEDGYNISGTQQQLATAYKAQGHFQRSSRAAATPNALYTALGIT